ncbi:TVP38/TMEM64 family protein [Legionella yabuuchiae]|uniref:TVP38/TMEM64 family protein n=1 Tax=Legionella yabuuchiae TaxID=376727 RepID=UPI001056139A|nr:TVP38/TMEM64 family protein [Legionella yabuuchiae]
MKSFCIAFAIAGLAFGATLFPHQVPIIINWINNLGYIAPVFFLFLYCVATLFFLPTMVVTLAGGALFGPALGTIFNVIGATIGAAMAFAISRYWLSDWVHSKQNKHVNQLIQGVERRGWQFVAFLRLVPIVPFNLVNYGLGLTRIKFSHYVLSTFIFLIPLEIISTYFGYAGIDFLAKSGVLYKRIFLGLIIILALAYLLFYHCKQKRSKR